MGTQRDTGGKPARVYALTGEGEELFPKAYALVLGELVEEIARVDGWERATALLRAVGQRAASGAAAPADRDGRVAAAAAALRSLGGDVEVQRTEQGYTLQGYACPLSAVTGEASGSLCPGPGARRGDHRDRRSRSVASERTAHGAGSASIASQSLSVRWSASFHATKELVLKNTMARQSLFLAGHRVS